MAKSSYEDIRDDWVAYHKKYYDENPSELDEEKKKMNSLYHNEYPNKFYYEGADIISLGRYFGLNFTTIKFSGSFIEKIQCLGNFLNSGIPIVFTNNEHTVGINSLTIFQNKKGRYRVNANVMCPDYGYRNIILYNNDFYNGVFRRMLPSK